jgi:RNA polymerase sigma factor (sigma-70 family)
MEQISFSESDTNNKSNQAKSESGKNLAVSAEVLVEQLRPMINSSAARAAGEFPGFREDFISEGVLAVLCAVDRFQQKKGQPEHFAGRYIRGRLLNSRRALRHLYHEVAVGAFKPSDDEELRDIWAKAEYEQAKGLDPVRRLESSIDGAMVRSHAPSILTANELEVIDSIYFENLTATKVATQMQISVPRVSQLHKSALKKLRKRFGVSLN